MGEGDLEMSAEPSGGGYIKRPAGFMNLFNVFSTGISLVLFCIWFASGSYNSTQYVIYVTANAVITQFVFFCARVTGKGRSCSCGNPHSHYLWTSLVEGALILGGAIWMTVEFDKYQDTCDADNCKVLGATMVFLWIASVGLFVTAFFNYKDYKKTS